MDNMEDSIVSKQEFIGLVEDPIDTDVMSLASEGSEEEGRSYIINSGANSAVRNLDPSQDIENKYNDMNLRLQRETSSISSNDSDSYISNSRMPANFPYIETMDPLNMNISMRLPLVAENIQKELWKAPNATNNNDKALLMLVRDLKKDPDEAKHKKKPFLAVSSHMNYTTLETRKTVSTANGELLKLDKDFIEPNSVIIAKGLANPAPFHVSDSKPKVAPTAQRVAVSKVELHRGDVVPLSDEIRDICTPVSYQHRVPSYSQMPSKVFSKIASLKSLHGSTNFDPEMSSTTIVPEDSFLNTDNNSWANGSTSIMTPFASLNDKEISAEESFSATKLENNVTKNGIKHTKKSAAAIEGPHKNLKGAKSNIFIFKGSSGGNQKEYKSTTSLGLKGGKLTSAPEAFNTLENNGLNYSLDLMRKISNIQSLYSSDQMSRGAESADSRLASGSVPSMRAPSPTHSTTYSSRRNSPTSAPRLDNSSNIVWDPRLLKNFGDSPSETSSVQREMQFIADKLGCEVHASLIKPLNIMTSVSEIEKPVKSSIKTIKSKGEITNDDVDFEANRSSLGMLSEPSTSDAEGQKSLGPVSTGLDDYIPRSKSELILGISSMTKLPRTYKKHGQLESLKASPSNASAMHNRDPADLYSTDPSPGELPKSRYQVHRRLMGWKMTNFKRKKDLISILDMTHMKNTDKTKALNKLKEKLFIDDESDKKESNNVNLMSPSNEDFTPSMASSDYRLLGHNLIAEGVIPVNCFDGDAISFFKPDELLKVKGVANENSKSLITKSMIEILSRNATSPEGRLRQISAWGATVGRLAQARDRTPAQRAKNAFNNKHKDADKEEDWTAKLRYQDRNDIMQNFTAFAKSGFYNSGGKGDPSETSSFGWNKDYNLQKERHLKWYGAENLEVSYDDAFPDPSGLSGSLETDDEVDGVVEKITGNMTGILPSYVVEPIENT